MSSAFAPMPRREYGRTTRFGMKIPTLRFGRSTGSSAIWKGDRIWHEDPDVEAWEEYWVFGSHEDQWKLKEMLFDGKGEALWDQENFDEGTGQQMLDWYYSKDRAA